MIPVDPTDAHVAWWAERDGGPSQRMVIGGPEEAPDVIPCPALVHLLQEPAGDGTSLQLVHHVAFQLDEIELAALAQGGTLWLTTWGGLPIHRLEVGP